MKAFEIGRYLRSITFNVKSYITSQLKPHGLSEGHFEYFIMIYKHQGINQKKLSEMMYTGKAGVTKAVKRLLDQELIYRSVNEEDQRNYGLYVTEKGEGFVELFHSIGTDIHGKMLHDFTAEEIEMLVYLLNKLHNNSKKL